MYKCVNLAQFPARRDRLDDVDSAVIPVVCINRPRIRTTLREQQNQPVVVGNAAPSPTVVTGPHLARVASPTVQQQNRR